jgi:PIN domain nuclease of toxin-antitoxin system
MPLAVLDTSAFLALFKGEQGADKVAAVMHDCVMSSVNAAEVHSKLADWGMPAVARDQAFAAIPATIVDFDTAQARLSGELRSASRQLGLSLGDRACLALAARTGLAALTSDQAWGRLGAGVKVELIRS